MNELVATELAVLGYSMYGRTGELTPLAEQPHFVSRPGGSYGIAVHPNGDFVFVNEVESIDLAFDLDVRATAG
jgi:hypothetical protein